MHVGRTLLASLQLWPCLQSAFRPEFALPTRCASTVQPMRRPNRIALPLCQNHQRKTQMTGKPSGFERAPSIHDTMTSLGTHRRDAPLLAAAGRAVTKTAHGRPTLQN